MSDSAANTAVDTDPFLPEAEYTAELINRDGTKSSARLELGGILKPDDPLPSDFKSSLSRACAVDPQRDVVVPARLTVKNEDERFNASIDSGFYVGGYDAMVVTDFNVEIAADYSAGADCQETGLSGADASVSYDDVAPGQEQTTTFLAVLHNYYSPDLPDGDTAAFAALRGVVDGNKTCFSGPGSYDGIFMLDGSQAKRDGDNSTPDCP